jgi:putative glycerol-1-phosphate prenyltransferase
MKPLNTTFLEAMNNGKKLFLVLIDPDYFTNQEQIARFVEQINQAQPDMILIGGSLTVETTTTIIRQIKERCSFPLVLFPGNTFQFTPEADGLLLLSLISGRNPDLLIGQHIVLAQTIKRSGIETISTGYILVESDHTTAVEYISNTHPIPRTKPAIAAATALAGMLLGNQLIYLEAGSGAYPPVPSAMISAVKESIDIPLIVGGGLRSINDITKALEAGADAIVVGNILEDKPELMDSFAKTIHQFYK